MDNVDVNLEIQAKPNCKSNLVSLAPRVALPHAPQISHSLHHHLDIRWLFPYSVHSVGSVRIGGTTELLLSNVRSLQMLSRLSAVGPLTPSSNTGAFWDFSPPWISFLPVTSCLVGLGRDLVPCVRLLPSPGRRARA